MGIARLVCGSELYVFSHVAAHVVASESICGKAQSAVCALTAFSKASLTSQPNKPRVVDYAARVSEHLMVSVVVHRSGTSFHGVVHPGSVDG